MGFKRFSEGETCFGLVCKCGRFFTCQYCTYSDVVMHHMVMGMGSDKENKLLILLCKQHKANLWILRQLS